MSPDVLISFLSQPVVFALVLVALLVFIGMYLRHRQRRRALREIEAMAINEFPNATEADHRAYDLLRKRRTELWQEWEQERDFSPTVGNAGS